MLLTVMERFMLLNVLPGIGDLTTLRVVKEAQDSLGWDDGEHDLLKFTQGHW